MADLANIFTLCIHSVGGEELCSSDHVLPSNHHGSQNHQKKSGGQLAILILATCIYLGLSCVCILLWLINYAVSL